MIVVCNKEISAASKMLSMRFPNEKRTDERRNPHKRPCLNNGSNRLQFIT